jgi:sugar (pentulose or hexulose) kinase
MIRYVAVIDLGKTNSKLALVDALNAEEIYVISVSARVNSDGLYPAIDHQAIERFLISAFKKLSKQHSIDAITVTTHGATVALLDEVGDLALPVMDYECPLPDELASEYDAQRSPFALTGSPRLPGGLNIGAQLFWQQRRYPEQFAKVKTILTWPQYWVSRLTGKRYNDVTCLGAHSDLYDPHKKEYSPLVNNMRWTELMAPISQVGDYVGQVNDKMTQLLGLQAAVPVHTGIHDSNASLVPHLLANKGNYSVVSTGTWFISMSIGGVTKPLDEKQDTLLNVNAFGNSVPSARFMGGRERELAIAQNNKAHCEPRELLDYLSEIESTPAILMPSIVRGTGPYPDACSTWLGTDCEDDVLRNGLISLYMALMSTQCLGLINASGPTYLEGPLAHDELFVSMLQVASAQDVHVSTSVTGTSVGAAMMITAPTDLKSSKACKVDKRTHDILNSYAEIWQSALKNHIPG